MIFLVLYISVLPLQDAKYAYGGRFIVHCLAFSYVFKLYHPVGLVLQQLKGIPLTFASFATLVNNALASVLNI